MNCPIQKRKGERRKKNIAKSWKKIHIKKKVSILITIVILTFNLETRIEEQIHRIRKI